MTVMCLSTTSDQSAERTAATFSLSSAVVLELRRNERKRNGSICRFRKPWQKRSRSRSSLDRDSRASRSRVNFSPRAILLIIVEIRDEEPPALILGCTLSFHALASTRV